MDNIDLNSHIGIKFLMTALAGYGVYNLSKSALYTLKSFLKYCVLPRRDLYSRYGGGWALVTGASDGLGKQYCFEFAKSGFNIILMARNSEKCEQVAKEIRDEH